MFYYLADGDPEIDAMMRSVCEIGGRTGKLTDWAIRLKGYPETSDRAEASVATAKRQPRSARHRRTKAWVYSVQYNWFRNHFENHPGAVAVAWNGLTGTRRAFMAAARDARRGRLFMERAPLPGRVTVDPAGVNELNGLSRDPDFFRDWAAANPDLAGPGWRDLKARLTARASRRSDVGQGGAGADLAATPFIFCPLQVPDDTQIRQFGGWAGDMDSFIGHLSDAARALPDGWQLRLKEHPSAKVSLAPALEAAAASAPGRIVVDNAADTFAQVAASRAVVTLNSSVGLQAFFFDKPVFVTGRAFFRIPGLTTPIEDAGGLRAAFAGVDEARFDAGLRDAFMAYLDRVYYPQVVTGPDGKVCGVAADLVRPKIAQALAAR